tara:strand:+ start:8099 stop:8551 length:453 start_codon:yes stop_codon:yes gene_type:complete
MQQAIQSAFQGVRNDEGGPFGAAVVKGDQIISVAHNTVLIDKDPTCHAEVNAIRMACKVLGTHILSDCELYTTVEPCPMCLSAIYWARIKKVYAAAQKNVAAKYGFDDVFIYEQLDLAPEARTIPCEHTQQNKESEAVFQQWKELERSLY